MASHSRSQMSLLLLHDLWLASLTGPPSTILPLQKSLLNTILSHSLPSPLYEKASTTLFTNIALLYAYNGSLALASTNFEEAIARSDQCAIAHFGLGLTRFLESHDADAIQAWTSCVKSFERTAPEGIEAGGWMGTNSILYQMWRPGQYGENQWGASHQDDLGHEGDDNENDQGGWVLAKDDVRWNLHVAKRRWKEKCRSDKNPDLKKDTDMLFVKGIPAGMLFGPPLELRQEVFVQSKEVDGQYLKGPVTKTDPDGAEAHIDDNGMSSRSVSPSVVLQVAPIPIQDRDPSKAYNHQPRPGVSSLTLKIKNEDDGYLSVYHKRGQSSPAIFQGSPKAAWSENRDEASADAFAYQPAVTSTFDNSQLNEMPSSHINRYHNGYRTVDDLATFNTPEKRKPLPLIPGRQQDMSYQDSQYALPLQQQQPLPPPPTLTHSRALSAKASSLARFFTKAKRARGGKGTHSRTGSNADAGIDADSRPDAGVDISESDCSGSHANSHPTSRGFVASRANTPISDDNRGKGTSFAPGRPAPPTQGLSAQGFQEGHPLNLAFVKADTQPRFIGVGLASKLEWEKNMEPRADDEAKPPKPLFFPREEINRKPERKSGIGLGLGKVNTMPILPSQNRNQPAPLSIPHTAPSASTNFARRIVGDDSISNSSILKEKCRRVLIFNDQSDTGINAAYCCTRGTAKPRTRTTPYLNLDFNHHPPEPAVSVSVPAFPQRTSSLSPVGLSSSAPSCPLPQPPPPPPPPQQQPPPQQRQQYQRRGRPLSQLGHELEWDDEKGDFVVRNDEEKGKGKWNKKRDESTSSSIQMRRARDRSKRRRQKETDERNTTEEISTSITTTNTPLESINGHTSIKIPSHTHNNSTAVATTINLKEQNAHQSVTYAYPTLTPIPSSQAFCFGHDFNCANDDEEEQEKEQEETDDVSERSIDIIEKIEDLECAIQNDEGCLIQSPTPGEGFALAECGDGQEPEEGGEEDAEDEEEKAEEEDDREEEKEKSEEGEQEEKEEEETMGLLSSAAFQGFGAGMAGQWYDGKWH